MLFVLYLLSSEHSSAAVGCCSVFGGSVAHVHPPTVPFGAFKVIADLAA